MGEGLFFKRSGWERGEWGEKGGKGERKNERDMEEPFFSFFLTKKFRRKNLVGGRKSKHSMMKGWTRFFHRTQHKSVNLF